jgi:hypothetical protein
MIVHLSTEQLQGYRQRELKPDDFLVADRHLISCAYCRSRLRAIGPAPALPSFVASGVEIQHLTYDEMEPYVDSQLDVEARARVERHAKWCTRCAEELLDLQAFALRMGSAAGKAEIAQKPAAMQSVSGFFRAAAERASNFYETTFTRRTATASRPFATRRLALVAGGVVALAALAIIIFLPPRFKWNPKSTQARIGRGEGASVTGKKQQIEIPIGTRLAVKVNQGVSSDGATEGDLISGTLAAPVEITDSVVIPEGAEATLQITRVSSAKVGATPLVKLRLVQITVQGKHYPVASNSYERQGRTITVSKKKSAIVGGTGAAIGGALKRGKGAAVGGAAGAGAAYAAQKANHSPAEIAAEGRIEFTLTGPLFVDPKDSRQ